jgi:hypothetical protein
MVIYCPQHESLEGKMAGGEDFNMREEFAAADFHIFPQSFSRNVLVLFAAKIKSAFRSSQLKHHFSD